MREAQKLGFAKAIAPEAARNDVPEGFTLVAIVTLDNLVADIARDSTPALRRVSRQDG
jgi:predicted ATP-dependent serine protease